MEVDPVGGPDVFVAEDERDRCWVDAVAEKVHRETVAEGVRRDVLGPE